MNDYDLERYISRLESYVEYVRTNETKEESKVALTATGVLDSNGNVVEQLRDIIRPLC
jgi:hypothetical protein